MGYGENRVLEGLTNIFWLASWATFASYATALNVAGAGRGLARRDRDDDDDGPSAGIAAGLAAAGLGPKAAKAGNAASLRSAADIAIAVDAGIGAVIWVLFIVTLFTTGQFEYRIRKDGEVLTRYRDIDFSSSKVDVKGQSVCCRLRFDVLISIKRFTCILCNRKNFSIKRD